jgi:broad specificity phosphatase PhoE
MQTVFASLQVNPSGSRRTAQDVSSLQGPHTPSQVVLSPLGTPQQSAQELLSPLGTPHASKQELLSPLNTPHASNAKVANAQQRNA